MTEGAWLKGRLRQAELSGKTLGILGLGKIGARLAEMCMGVGMPIIYWSRTRKPNLEERLRLAYVSFDDLFKASDILSIHLALTDETENIVGVTELSLMKPSSFLINTARGAVVDEDALYDALSSNRLAGAGLDVFPEEPYKGKLGDLPNVVLTPHVGSDTREAQLRSGTELAQKIMAGLGV
jgi:phosphoglycerate dehydrogenase-like enzyme